MALVIVMNGRFQLDEVMERLWILSGIYGKIKTKEGGWQKTDENRECTCEKYNCRRRPGEL